MKVKVSTKGQLVLPLALRHRLRIQAGDTVEFQIENERAILTPTKRRKFKTWIETSPMTGLPVMVSEPGAPKITGEWVRKMMEEFP